MIDSCHSSHVAQGGVRAVTEMSSMRVRTEPITLDGMVLSVDAESEQFPSLYVSTIDEDRFKAHKVNLKGDAESNPEK